tara:strand:+ start:819 stop:1004 length:186 start_codon:yes stop_codon:yes gene_type:complete
MSIQTVKKIHDHRMDAINEAYLMLHYTNGQQFCVPKDSVNRHYQAILEWAEIDGNTIEDAD